VGGVGGFAGLRTSSLGWIVEVLLGWVGAWRVGVLVKILRHAGGIR
jgi:uncharacterized membrane protein YeaQ/YmgE (transglycosylase-associated protein family)